MALAPARPCPRCRRLVRGRCEVCERRRQQARPSSVDRGYDKAWSAYSRRWLQRFPFCGMRMDGELHPEHSRCAREGHMVIATCTDHIVSMSLGGSKWDRSNHQSLCAGCNARKAIACEGSFRRL
jgi:5-methylcytosine-specific restriction endonuclease McrA